MARVFPRIASAAGILAVAVWLSGQGLDREHESGIVDLLSPSFQSASFLCRNVLERFAAVGLRAGGPDPRTVRAVRVRRLRRRRRRAQVRRWRLAYTAMATPSFPAASGGEVGEGDARSAAAHRPVGLHSGTISGTPPPPGRATCKAS